jgi:DNA mismatch repair protein MutS
MTKENIRGVLLYGINSSGKSSFMKSIGVAVVLAQSGFYVPAESMRFSVFSEIFTRILARDNFEKGLSSFGVEMMELKNIFNRYGPKSLILGDEISHGTETLSALSIVGATIEHLTLKGSFFLFTTHLHQLCNLDRIQSLKEVVSVHLEVSYDVAQDKLIFERKLQPGSGSSIYGLEFAESLHIDKEFMKRAQTIRKELAQDYQELELLTKKQKSKYHKELYLSSCAICKNMVEDTHHIAPQETADAEGNIDGHFHKNHKYNLLPLCKDCHNRVHEGKLIIRGFVMTSNGLEIDFEEK